MSRFTTGLLLAILMVSAVRAAEGDEALWAAARKGDAAAVEALLAKGVDVNAKTPYGATALFFAAGKGHLDVVKVLIRNKADVNAKDTFYKVSPLNWAAMDGHAEVIGALLEAGAEGAEDALANAAAAGEVEIVKVVLDKGKPKPEALTKALDATPANSREITELLTRAGAKPTPKPEPKPGVEVEASVLETYAGTYRNDDAFELTVSLRDGKLSASLEGRSPTVLTALDNTTFRRGDNDALKVVFEQRDGKVSGLLWKTNQTESRYKRVEKTAAPKPGGAAEKTVRVETPLNWPSFRGPNASGVADGQHPPTTWDVEKGTSVRWKTAIPGLGLSCPVVWGDRVFVTTAVSGDPKASLKPGLYGSVDSVDDKTEHTWQVLCLDKATGKVLWDVTACKGVPKVKRHLKGSHATSTVATDGKHVVACFASEGLYCYDFAGKLVWKRDLGTLDSGWFFDADYQWGFGSSPIIYRDMVILQCDIGKGSFLAAYRVTDGKDVWMVPRDEIPSWGTPTVVEGPERAELVTNATKFARGYDPMTGKELWRLGRHSEITVPTPVFGQGLIFVTSGYRPVQPIYAIRPGASGDISLKDKQTSNDSIAWSADKGGPYLPTPIVYGEYFYTCSNNGIVNCYKAKTGERVYRERLGGSGAYTASPVAADGKLYFVGEEDGVKVVKAGPEFELLADNPLGDVCLATPAISDGMLLVRTQRHLFGFATSPSRDEKDPR